MNQSEQFWNKSLTNNCINENKVDIKEFLNKLNLYKNEISILIQNLTDGKSK